MKINGIFAIFKYRVLPGVLLFTLGAILGAGTPAKAQNEPLSLPGFINDPEKSSQSGDGQSAAQQPQSKDEKLQFEKTQEELEAKVREEAFDAALQGLLPLKPQEIRRLLEYYDRTRESVEVPVYPAPKPEVAVETLSLDPGHKPAVVKLAFGNVTTFNTLDITGAPWPIEDITWAGNFDIVETDPGSAGNIIRITPQTEFAQGNMSMRLNGLNTPVIVMLETRRDVVHYRFDAVIPQVGPLGKSPLIKTGTGLSAGNIDLTRLLQGVPPADFERLNVLGLDGRTSAYTANGKTYVRTPLTLLSPGWSQTVSSADGMRVYEINDSPVILVSDDGAMVRARLTRREDLVNDQ